MASHSKGVTVVKVDQSFTENTLEINQKSVRSPELLKALHAECEKEYHNVQSTVKSIKELNIVSENRNAKAIELAWSNITITTLDGSKTLLQGATGKIKSRFLAIMGPSGT
jgi:hypothetical protein